MNDSDYMKRALKLAKKGAGFVSPNPMVGAVIVKDGKIIGEGYHMKYGEPHAERNALASCTESPKGATMYVTLEPCCHHGKQPPCTDAVLEAGIRRIVIGSGDPNPLVAGKGINILRNHGVEVVENVLEDECRKLNEIFMHYIKTKKPFITMKYAMTIDGKIACFTGESKWITGEDARKNVHENRHRYSAIMAGIGTILTDDPLLTCRIPGGKNPVRIICDTQLRTPLSSNIIKSAEDVPTIIATCSGDKEKHKLYENSGCRILVTDEFDGHLDLQQLTAKLGEEKIDSILLEGGGTLNWSALQSRIVNKVQTYIAPKILGGTESKTPIEGTGVPSPKCAFFLKNSIITKFGDDFLIESEVDYDVHGNY